MLLIIIWYFFHNYFWPRPRSSGLGLEVLASFNITGVFQLLPPTPSFTPQPVKTRLCLVQGDVLTNRHFVSLGPRCATVCRQTFELLRHSLHLRIYSRLIYSLSHIIQFNNFECRIAVSDFYECLDSLYPCTLLSFNKVALKRCTSIELRV